MNTDDIVDSLERCFISPDVTDSNMEPANVVDVIDNAARSLGRIAHAITPTDALPMKTPNGGRVGSLTEAVVYAADSLSLIAAAIRDLASAVRDRHSGPQEPSAVAKQEVNGAADFDGTDIRTLNLSVRTKNVLLGGGIYTVEQLVAGVALRKIKDCGPKSIAEIEKALAAMAGAKQDAPLPAYDASKYHGFTPISDLVEPDEGTKG